MENGTKGSRVGCFLNCWQNSLLCSFLIVGKERFRLNASLFYSELNGVGVKSGANKNGSRRLKWYQQLLLHALVLLVRLWTQTLRFKLDRKGEELRKNGFPNSVFILWHNRLFVAPVFVQCYLPDRKWMPLVSASGDGVWLNAFLRQMQMHPISGSRHNRGTQALRELIQASKSDADIAITPDGSRGPIYDMKVGAVAVAMKTNRPIILLSFNFSKAWRLNTWDRFYVPLPFTSIEAKMEMIEHVEELGSGDSKALAKTLKRRLDAITEDDEMNETRVAS